MTTPVMYATSNAWIGFGVETDFGVAVDPTIFVPLEDPDWVPKLTWLQDKGLRGSPGVDYDDVPGVRHDEINWKMGLFADVLPYMFLSMMGTDTVTGTAAPYTHTNGLINNTTGSQPPSLTITYFDGYKLRQFAGVVITKLDLEMEIEAAVVLAVTAIALPEQDTTDQTNSYNGEHMIPSWDTAVTVGTLSTEAISALSISFERVDAAPVHTNGQQAAHFNFQGPLQVTGKLTAVLDSNDDVAPNVLPDGLERLQQVLTPVFTDPVTGHSLTVQMSAAQFEDPAEKTDKPYLVVDSNFRAIMNSTDATDSGLAPCKVITTNALSTAA